MRVRWLIGLMLATCGDGSPHAVGPASFVITAAGVDVDAGSSATTSLTVKPAASHALPIQVALAEAPVGLSVEPVTIPAGATSATLAIHAASGVRFDGTVVLLADDGTGQASVPLRITAGITGGRLDRSFGDDGFVTVTRTGACAAMSAGPGNELTLVYADGEISVLRLGSDGRLDPGFALGGVRELSRPPRVDVFAVAADGSMLAEALLGFTTEVWRLGTDGLPDTAFASGGLLSINFVAAELSEVSEGVLLAGRNWAVSVSPSGSLDPQRGPSVARFQLPQGVDDGTGAPLLLDDGGFIVATTTLDRRSTVVRLGADRTTAAWATSNVPNSSYIRSPVADRRGGFYLLEVIGAPNELPDAVRLVHVGPDLAPDPAFGVGGRSLDLPFGVASLVGVQSDGKPVVAIAGLVNSYPMTFIRFQPDGALDQTYRTAGMADVRDILHDNDILRTLYACPPIMDARDGIVFGYNVSTSLQTVDRFIRVTP